MFINKYPNITHLSRTCHASTVAPLGPGVNYCYFASRCYLAFARYYLALAKYYLVSRFREIISRFREIISRFREIISRFPGRRFILSVIICFPLLTVCAILFSMDTS